MTIDMFRLGGKPLGYDNLVIAVDTLSKLKGQDIREYIRSSDECIAELDFRGVYIVRPKFEDTLKEHNITYRILAKYPMPKEVRERIRKRLKEKGVSAQL